MNFNLVIILPLRKTRQIQAKLNRKSSRPVVKPDILSILGCAYA